MSTVMDPALSTVSARNQMAFQERMSNTAHQREVADLQAAGLNPVLSAGGKGASTPEGAEGDFSNGEVINLLASSINTNARMAGAAKNAAKAASDAVDQMKKDGYLDPKFYVNLNEKGNTLGIPNSFINAFGIQGMKSAKYIDDILDVALPGYVDSKNKIIASYGAPENAYEKVMQNFAALIGTGVNAVDNAIKNKKFMKTIRSTAAASYIPDDERKKYSSNYRGGSNR